MHASGVHAKGGGSIGRAAVSKTAGCRFESCPPCISVLNAPTTGPTIEGLNHRKGERVSPSKSDEATDVAESKRGSEPKRGIIGRIALFFRQVMGELKKVVTPTRAELFKFTGVVLVFVIFMMALVTVLDLLFGWGASWVFGQGSSFFPSEPAATPVPTE